METNLLDRLFDLLPGDTVRVGDVTATHADGTVTVQLLEGGTLRVSGTHASGSRVFVQGGWVTGDAPVLEFVEIEV
ncbi:hypothetical protein NH8B_1966 [Pseudogulbenkiania sp. NH8B]|uniref:hypothetical protein n=1 Tax=Pseudogulbenkiania sp. (strain NH8B) TaxID=748280 RepID=UPI00022798C5|nr:hypothetical protein [Pseudogulbenkiania sp. NH8B]BAK76781.1 hypothetical protein NH8B_1966 [Pseudogulbenkiania sp. NH8B]